MVAEARAVRRRMLDDAERRRAAVRADLLQARAAIDEALAALGAADAEATAPGAARPVEPGAPTPRADDDATGAPESGVDDDATGVFAKLRAEAAAPAEPSPEASSVHEAVPVPDADPPDADPPDADPRDPAERDPLERDPPERDPADADPAARDPLERDPAEGDQAEGVEEDAVEPDGAEADAAPAASPSADEEVRSRRDSVLTPLMPDLVRASKRLLQDEQNVLLDAVRRARTKVEPARLLPDPVHHRDAWAAVLAPAVDVAYASGRMTVRRRRKPADAPTRVLNELAAGLVAPLRERLTTTIDAVVAEGPYPAPVELHRALATAIGARYREWRSSDLEVHLGDVLAAAYARGVYEASPSGVLLRWVPERAGQCPDCDDDALEHTVKGQPFPTGQTHPPAHPGCRCLAVPDDGAETANL